MDGRKGVERDREMDGHGVMDGGMDRGRLRQKDKDTPLSALSSLLPHLPSFYPTTLSIPPSTQDSLSNAGTISRLTNALHLHLVI